MHVAEHLRDSVKRLQALKKKINRARSANAETLPDAAEHLTRRHRKVTPEAGGVERALGSPQQPHRLEGRPAPHLTDKTGLAENHHVYAGAYGVRLAVHAPSRPIRLSINPLPSPLPSTAALTTRRRARLCPLAMVVHGLRATVCYLAAGVFVLLVLALSTASYSGTTQAYFGEGRLRTLNTDRLLEDTQNATLGFEKIIVINLKSRTDHRDSIALAAALTGLKLDYIDGVTEVSKKALPPGGAGEWMKAPELGNWRAHMDAARMMVENNIASALILEDDADWDVRIKQQMRDFAKGTRLLMQPVAGSKDDYLDATFPSGLERADDQKPVNLYVKNEPPITKPTISPYGDNWDMLWIGHCGTVFPQADDAPRLSLGRAVITDDETVPEKQHVAMQFGNDDLINEYAEHTRVVSRAHRNMCTLGYALSLRGAQKLLYELSIKWLDETTDVSLGHFCDGVGRDVHMCFTVQPQLFQHHRPVAKKASFSDISDKNDEMNEQAFTRNVRWSTRMNIPKLINGEKDYIDLWQDGQPFHDYGWS